MEEEKTFSVGEKKAFFGIPAKCAVTAGQMICIFLMVLSLGILMILANIGVSLEDIGSSKKYTDTADCASQMFGYMADVSGRLREARRFEKDGVLNEELQIDITNLEALRESTAILDEYEVNPDTAYTLRQLQLLYNDDGAYELSDLYDRYDQTDFGTEGYSGYDGYYYSRLSKEYLDDEGTDYTRQEVEAAVAAALRTDGTAAERSETSVKYGVVRDSEEEAEEYAEPFRLTDSEIELAKQIQELSGESVTTCSDAFLFLFDQGKKIESQGEKTVSDSTLAEYAAKNKNEVSLQELYQALAEAVSICKYNYSTSELLENIYVNSNIRFYIKDGYGNIYTNINEWRNNPETFDRKNSDFELSMWYQRKNGIITEMEQTGKDTAAGRHLKSIYSDHVMIDKDETVFLGLDTELPNNDSIYRAARSYDKYVPWINVLLGLAIGSLILWLILVVIGTIQSGHNACDRKIQLCAMDRMPTEVEGALILICCSAVIALAFWGFAACINYEAAVWILVLESILAAACYGICLIFYYSIVRRIKGKNLWSSSLVRSILSICKGVYAARNTSTRLILLFGGFVLMHLILLGGVGTVLCLIVDGLVLLYMIREASGRQSVIEGLQQIGAGDLDYKVDTTNLIGDNLELAETVNRVGDGLQAAVKERMKSERLKADLITNVSHDIKTPLTSIINYVDLLKRENIQDPRIKGYIEILDSKSQRLKQLTEDLVEASKVSSGNVKLEFVTLNLNELVQQMNGEFDERFSNRNLSVVMKMPKESLRISADGRRIWRVLENLYGNAAKYAMPGTRVYVETGKKDGRVIFTMKNISENPLNIEAEELTERFIRGDVSRSTEGSGLGLSIAQNLTRLQHGTFDIYLDGDLFKVTLTFSEVWEIPKPKPEMEAGTQEK